MYNVKRDMQLFLMTLSQKMKSMVFPLYQNHAISSIFFFCHTYCQSVGLAPLGIDFLAPIVSPGADLVSAELLRYPKLH